jgi:hypothetical protein
VEDCRQQALEARARGDYETFHDFAWRAVQKGKPNDPGLMYLLARAQSLSGRPGDALVMLQRLRLLGITTDAATNDDFRRVRTLKGWAEFAAPSSRAAPEPSAPEPSAPAPSAPVAAAPSPAMPAAALTFEAPMEFDPVGLAYDAVSRRFLIGDRAARRLVIVDELSRHVVTLVSAASADFLDRISGFAIDPKRGDLWVASTDEQQSVLHKLQLVSGRVLMRVTTDLGSAPVRFEDVVVAGDGTVLAVDAVGGRVFRLRPGARQLEVAHEIGSEGTRTLTLGTGNALYVGGTSGLSRVEFGRRAAVPLTEPGGETVSNIGRLRWSAGSLVALQETSTGPRLIRIALDAGGKTIKGVEVLDQHAASATTGTVSDRMFFYLAPGGAIRSISLR